MLPKDSNENTPIGSPTRQRGLRRLWAGDLSGLSQGSTVELSSEESRHGAKVLRLTQGDEVVLVDGLGHWAQSKVADVGSSKRSMVCEIVSVQAEHEPARRVTIACAIPKGGRLEEMVDQLTQIGASNLWLIQTQRGETDIRDARMERAHRRMQEACKQACRTWAMTIEGVMDLSQSIEKAKSSDAAMFVGEPDAARVLGNQKSEAQDTVIWIGPEGGWTEDELTMLHEAGAKACQLGPHVMRIETAAVAGAVAGCVGFWSCRSMAGKLTP